MSLKTHIFLLVLLSSLTFRAQVKIGEWRDYLSYNTCNTVAKAGNIVYASNGTAIIKYNTSDGSIERLSKFNGLSDIGITHIRHNPNNNAILIIYDNSNIDVIKGNSITNVSDIKRKAITGKKNINEVTFKNNLAYLACGFGIVVFDTDKMEIKDTYVIGPNGTYINVYQVAYTDSTFFAATSNGVFKANYKTGILNNFQNWKKQNDLPTGTYNGVVNYNGKIITNYAPFTAAPVTANLKKDTLYAHNGTSWSKSYIKTYPYTLAKLLSFKNTSFFNCIDEFGYECYNTTGERLAYLNQFPYGLSNILDVYTDFSNPQLPEYWVGDTYFGLIDSKGAHPFYPNTKIYINGTNSNNASSIYVHNGQIVSAPTIVEEDGKLKYSREGVNFYNGSEWTYIKESVYDTIFDINYAIIDKKNPNHLWASSWKNGLIEYQNGQMVNVYNSVNSVIPHISVAPDWHRTAGLCYDKSGNLWIGSSDVTNFLSVKKANGTFQNFQFSIPTTQFVSRVMADKNDQIWVLFPRGYGIAVFKNNNFAQPNSSNTKFLTPDSLKGKLPSLFVHSIAEDLSGHIWIGTSKGVAVFYSPSNVTGGGNYDCQQIKITQDGHVQILLETEKVTAIAVDGANRKWIGTEAAGVFCFSPDGQQQVFHFTKEDSPLFSNTIIDLAYDDVTGDVIVATDRGLQSYRTPVIKGEDEFTNVHAFPNPVKPDYSGPVYIKGLIDESIIKITDASGNLVWEAKSLGGQIEWALKTFNGQRVASGVYLAYCATADGSQKAVAKIMVLN